MNIRRGVLRLLLRLAILAFVALVLALGWAFLIEPGLLTVHEAHLCLPGWPTRLQAIRIAALGDLHVGSPHNGVEQLRRVVAETNGAKPDLIVLLGDYVIHDVWGGSFVEPEVTALELRKLRAPFGVVAILGNHDWWYDGDRVRRALESAQIRVLENDALKLDTPAGSFWVAGLADLWTRNPDPATALKSVPPGSAVIMLTHSPDVFPTIPSSVALTLAAHTHGGQVDLPLLGRRVVPSKFGARYAAGHIEENGQHLYVTTGIGTSIVPIRFRVPPEIALIGFDGCPDGATQDGV